jgi:hypothetical protein
VHSWITRLFPYGGPDSTVRNAWVPFDKISGWPQQKKGFACKSLSDERRCWLGNGIGSDSIVDARPVRSRKNFVSSAAWA